MGSAKHAAARPTPYVGPATRLERISVPTLVVAGRHGGMVAGQEHEIHAGIPNSELVVFGESSHYPFAEEPGRFLSKLDDFLTRWESRVSP